MEARSRSLSYLYSFYCQSGVMSGSFSPYPEGRLFYGFWVGEILRALSETLLAEDQSLRSPTTAVKALIEIEFEDETTICTEDGKVLTYNTIVIQPRIEMEFNASTEVTTETGDIFALE